MKPTYLFIIILILIFGAIAGSVYFNKDTWDLKTCTDECQHRGYETGDCLWPTEAEEIEDLEEVEIDNIGSCFIAQSKHCGNKDQCNCYCKNKLIACTEEAKICPDGTAVGRTGPKCEFEKCPVSKICELEKDCIVFGKDGECNCGCYNKEALPKDSGGACFCAAPTSCKCINGQCEGIFGCSVLYYYALGNLS